MKRRALERWLKAHGYEARSREGAVTAGSATDR